MCVLVLFLFPSDALYIYIYTKRVIYENLPILKHISYTISHTIIRLSWRISDQICSTEFKFRWIKSDTWNIVKAVILFLYTNFFFFFVFFLLLLPALSVSLNKCYLMGKNRKYKYEWIHHLTRTDSSKLRYYMEK